MDVSASESNGEKLFVRIILQRRNQNERDGHSRFGRPLCNGITEPQKLLRFTCFLFFFIFCVALCFMAAARTDSERNEEKYWKEMKKITPLVIFKFLILESLICYCHSNLGGFYYTIIAPFLADNGWQRYSSKKYKHYK